MEAAARHSIRTARLTGTERPRRTASPHLGVGTARRWSRPEESADPGDFVAFLDAETGAHVTPDIIAFEGEDARMAGTVEVAPSRRGLGEERIRTFADSVPTPEGGTHAEGFRAGVTAAVNTYARQRGLLTAADPDLTTDHLGKRLTAVVSVKPGRPEYQGAPRGELGGATVYDCVEQAVREHLGTWLTRQPEQAADLIGRITRAASRD